VRLANVNDREINTVETSRVEVALLGEVGERTIGAAFDEYSGRLKAFAVAATRDDAAGEDVVQEAFLRLVKEVRARRTPDNIGGWLFRVASNLIKSAGRRHTVAERAKAFLVDRSVGISPEQVALGHEYDRQLMAALGRLDPDARLALLMAGNGSTSHEIAIALGRSTGATRTFLCRSRLHLREALAVVEETAR
jgi:RNA polymerase sigma-70 factor, ECF subfamily